MIAPSGPESDRVQLLIDYVGIVNSQKMTALGNPSLFHSIPAATKLLHQVEQLMHSKSETSTPVPEVAPRPPRTRVMRNGQYTQEFATQVQPSLNGSGFEMLGGANLAPPVVPHRNDGSKMFGTKAVSRLDNQNAYDHLMSMLPGPVAIKNTTSAVVPPVQPSSFQGLSQNTPSVTFNWSNKESQSELTYDSKETVVDLVSSSSSRSPSPAGLRLDDPIEVATENMNNQSYDDSYYRPMHEHGTVSHIGGGKRSLEQATMRPRKQPVHNISRAKNGENNESNIPPYLEAIQVPQSRAIVAPRSRSWTVSLSHGNTKSCRY